MFDYNTVEHIIEMHIANARYKFMLYHENKKTSENFSDFLKITDLKKMNINFELYKTFFMLQNTAVFQKLPSSFS